MDDALALAFDRAAGRCDPVRTAASAFDAFAGRVVAAGRRVTALPGCPRPLLRHALDLFEVRAPRGVAAAWRLLFDSWDAVVPATRGARGPRFLRFGGRGGNLDVEVAVAQDEGVRLRGTVDGPTGALVVEIAPRRGARVRVPVAVGGAFEASLPRGTGPFTLAVCAGRTTLSRTGRIPPPPRG
ncbi:MAG: hypothetical protein IT460_09595 [Planctomycetes bacterium]|nr:hypothetical protein [Planctomycetota bacterium]